MFLGELCEVGRVQGPSRQCWELLSSVFLQKKWLSSRGKGGCALPANFNEKGFFPYHSKGKKGLPTMLPAV